MSVGTQIPQRLQVNFACESRKRRPILHLGHLNTNPMSPVLFIVLEIDMPFVPLKPSALQLGLYIKIEGSWFSHPFSTNSFKIKTAVE